MEKNKIYCADNIRFMQENMQDSSVDLTVTSPPYDNLRSYNGFTWDFEGVAKELYRVTKDGGVVVWVVGDQTTKGSETGTSFRQALYFMSIGFNLHDTMIWDKETCIFPCASRYHQSFEYMFVFSKGQPKIYNIIHDRKNKWAGTLVHGTDREVDGTTMKKSGHNTRLVKDIGARFNVWRLPNTGKRGNKHPATFPEQLANDHIISWSNPGDLVFDPFCGSGTTCKMALVNKRSYIGIDVSEEYCGIAEKRIAETKVSI
jgi:site-specific DNA-methyltransferase (adenine-specific)